MENTNNQSDNTSKEEPKEAEPRNPMLLVKTVSMPTKMEFAEKKDDKKNSDEK